jgi:beta-phosphoglucomutase
MTRDSIAPPAPKTVRLDPARIRALIFDLDGVVLNSMPAHAVCWCQAFAEFGLEVAPEVIYRYEGALGGEETLDRLGAEHGLALTPDLFDRIYQRQRSLFEQDHSRQVSFFPEAVRLILDLSATSLDLALVTSSRREVLNSGVWQGLNHWFWPVVTGDRVVRHKPHPEPYLTALEALGLDRAEAVVIENAPAGIASARAAGLTCLALATTLSEAELAEAHQVFPDHAALRRYLAEQGLLV